MLAAPGPQTLHEKRLPLTSSSATGSTAPAEQFRAFWLPRRGHAATSAQTSHAVPFQPPQQRPHDGSGFAAAARDALFRRRHSSSPSRPQTQVAQLSFWTNLLPLALPTKAKSVASFAHGGAVSSTWMQAFETSCVAVAAMSCVAAVAIAETQAAVVNQRRQCQWVIFFCGR